MRSRRAQHRARAPRRPRAARRPGAGSDPTNDTVRCTREPRDERPLQASAVRAGVGGGRVTAGRPAAGAPAGRQRRRHDRSIGSGDPGEQLPLLSRSSSSSHPQRRPAPRWPSRAHGPAPAPRASRSSASSSSASTSAHRPIRSGSWSGRPDRRPVAPARRPPPRSHVPARRARSSSQSSHRAPAVDVVTASGAGGAGPAWPAVAAGPVDTSGSSSRTPLRPHVLAERLGQRRGGQLGPPQDRPRCGSRRALARSGARALRRRRPTPRRGRARARRGEDVRRPTRRQPRSPSSRCSCAAASSSSLRSATSCAQHGHLGLELRPTRCRAALDLGGSLQLGAHRRDAHDVRAVGVEARAGPAGSPLRSAARPAVACCGQRRARSGGRRPRRSRRAPPRGAAPPTAVDLRRRARARSAARRLPRPGVDQLVRRRTSRDRNGRGGHRGPARRAAAHRAAPPTGAHRGRAPRGARAAVGAASSRASRMRRRSAVRGRPCGRSGRTERGELRRRRDRAARRARRAHAPSRRAASPGGTRARRSAPGTPRARRSRTSRGRLAPRPSAPRARSGPRSPSAAASRRSASSLLTTTTGGGSCDGAVTVRRLRGDRRPRRSTGSTGARAAAGPASAGRAPAGPRSPRSHPTRSTVAVAAEGPRPWPRRRRRSSGDGAAQQRETWVHLECGAAGRESGRCGRLSSGPRSPSAASAEPAP